MVAPAPIFLLRRTLSNPLLLVGLFVLVDLSAAKSQVFQVQGGSSSLFQANGGSIEVHGSKYDGSIGAGILGDDLIFGALVRTQARGYKLSFGDDIIPLRLPPTFSTPAITSWDGG